MSEWTKKELAVLKDMALNGAKNAIISAALGKNVEEIYNKRSQFGITQDKVAKMDLEPCVACGTLCEVDGDSNNEYVLPNGKDGIFCESCKLAVDYVNENDEADEDSDSDDLEPEDSLASDELADDNGYQTDY